MSQRHRNFSDKEYVLLLSLVAQNKNIIENKKTDSATNQEKHQAWISIMHAFNASTSESAPRSLENLKKTWENKKAQARKAKGDHRIEILRTGGGVPPKILKDPHLELVLEIIDPMTVVGGEGPYGSDAQPLPSPAAQDHNYFLVYIKTRDVTLLGIRCSFSQIKQNLESEEEVPFWNLLLISNCHEIWNQV